MSNSRLIPFRRAFMQSFVSQIPSAIARIAAALSLFALWPNATQPQAPSVRTDVSFIAGREFAGAGGFASFSPISVADFNGDGRPDLVVLSSANRIAILFNQGNGFFGPPQDVAIGNFPAAVAVGDFNGDGKADLVFADSGSNTVSVLLGNGDGTFQAAQSFPVGAVPTTVATGDFNGDGRLDLAVANGSNVSVLLGNGDGTFQAEHSFPVGGGAYSLAVGDFNGDGRLDLAAATGGLEVLLGNGDGMFQAARDVNVFPDCRSVAVGDVNGDGRLDLVVARYDSPDAGVLLGNGDGSFQLLKEIIVPPNGVISAAVGDLNGDGLSDIAVASTETNVNTVSLLLSNGDGTFTLKQTINVNDPFLVAIADFNGDGHLDLAVDGDDLSVFLGNGDGTFQAAPTYSDIAPNGSTAIRGVAAGDFNGDGRQDLAFADSSGGVVSVLLGNGDGTFQSPATYPVGDSPFEVAVGDFNGDGRLDLAVSGESAVSILLGNGDGTFQAAQSVGSGGTSLAVADFNGDGRLDLAIAGTDFISILLGNGDGTFTPGPNLRACGTHVLIGDFNADGRSDVVGGGGSCSNGDASSVSVFLGNGDGTFQTGASVASGPDNDAVGTGDFNGDRRLDLVVRNNNVFSIFLGNDDGTFQQGQSVVIDSPGVSGAKVAVADFNGDGRLDLSVGGKFVLLGNGDGSFQPAHGFDAGVNAFWPAVGDFNGDGLPDIAVSDTLPSSGSTGVSILINNTAFSLTVTAASEFRQYGAANPAFNVSYSGFAAGDGPASLSGSLICTSRATAASPVGSYSITCSGLSSQKYAITYQPGVLTVAPAPLTVAANNATSILHGALPSFTASYSGFVNGDGPSSLAGSLNCSTNPASPSTVGSYAINCSGQTSNNYEIASKSGVLSIIYNPSGLCDSAPGHSILPPIDAGGTSVFHQGRTVPAQFRVCDANGVSVGAPGVVIGFNLIQISAGTVTDVLETVISTTPDNAFRWDSANQQWIFNISTANLAPGGTYTYTISLNDGSSLVFRYGLR